MQAQQIVVKQSISKYQPPSGDDLDLTFADCSLQGRRDDNEDTHIAIGHPAFNAAVNKTDNTVRGLFAVFDGHGGIEVSQFMANNLVKYLAEGFKKAEEEKTSVESKKVLRDAILACEAASEGIAGYSGSTAVIGLIEGSTLHVANIGDSRAVLCRQGVALGITEDHKPTSPDEMERIKRLGGVVSRVDPDTDKEIQNMCCLFRLNARMNHMSSPYRLWPGGLAMSRALGDFEAKPMCSSEPEMFEHSLTRDDSFLILACDGVWDVLTNSQAVALVIEEGSEIPEETSTALSQEAYDKGSTDNISNVCIFFGWSKTKEKTSLSSASTNAAREGEPSKPLLQPDASNKV